MSTSSTPTPEPQQPLRQRIGNYRVLKVLGAGGMGTVYLAEQEPIARQVAIKVLRPEVARNSEVAARLLNERREENPSRKVNASERSGKGLGKRSIPLARMRDAFCQFVAKGLNRAAVVAVVRPSYGRRNRYSASAPAAGMGLAVYSRDAEAAS